jgi:osmotically-inducible protein OsmY
MTIAVALVIVGALSVVALRAADQPSQRPYEKYEKKESATEMIKRTTNSTADKIERTAEIASKEISDSWITLKTKLSLFADERVSSKDVHVTTRQGVIVLTGKVGTEEARLAAEETAAKIDGAKKVENRVVVAPQAAQKAIDRADDQIVRDVERRIEKEAMLKTADITIHVGKGIVTLTGKAPTLRASVHASEVAYGVSGVRAVHNELNVEERPG